MYPEEIIIFYLLSIKTVLTTSRVLAEALAGMMEGFVRGCHSLDWESSKKRFVKAGVRRGATLGQCAQPLRMCICVVLEKEREGKRRGREGNGGGGGKERKGDGQGGEGRERREKRKGILSFHLAGTGGIRSLLVHRALRSEQMQKKTFQATLALSGGASKKTARVSYKLPDKNCVELYSIKTCGFHTYCCTHHRLRALRRTSREKDQERNLNPPTDFSFH